jgi:hypothetical protein
LPSALYFFLEGNDDERLFLRVVYPLLSGKYPKIETILYAEDSPKSTRKFIKSIESAGDEYIFVRDLDNAPCITERKKIVASVYRADIEGIVVVVKEIECWYLCGLDDQSCRKLGIRRQIAATDDMTKEDFDTLIPKGISHVEFMQQILEMHNTETGKQKNRSFKYFMENWIE